MFWGHPSHCCFAQSTWNSSSFFIFSWSLMLYSQSTPAVHKAYIPCTYHKKEQLQQVPTWIVCLLLANSIQSSYFFLSPLSQRQRESCDGLIEGRVIAPTISSINSTNQQLQLGHIRNCSRNFVELLILMGMHYHQAAEHLVKHTSTLFLCSS